MSWFNQAAGKLAVVVNRNKKGLVKTVAGVAGFVVGGPAGAVAAHKAANAALTKQRTSQSVGPTATDVKDALDEATRAAGERAGGPVVPSQSQNNRALWIGGGVAAFVLVLVLVLVVTTRRAA